MELYNTILASDESIKERSEQYSYVYDIVKKFIDENDLCRWKIGSVLEYWLDINCGPDDVLYKNSYCFETKITEDLCDHITKCILERFESSMDELVKNKCKLVLNRGL